MILYPPNTSERQRNARDKIEAWAVAWRESPVGREYNKRRRAAMKGVK